MPLTRLNKVHSWNIQQSLNPYGSLHGGHKDCGEPESGSGREGYPPRPIRMGQAGTASERAAADPKAWARNVRRMGAGGLRVLGFAILILACVFLSASPALAQGLATLRGTVTDASGAVVPSATVTVEQTGTRLTR